MLASDQLEVMNFAKINVAKRNPKFFSFFDNDLSRCFTISRILSNYNLTIYGNCTPTIVQLESNEHSVATMRVI